MAISSISATGSTSSANSQSNWSTQQLAQLKNYVQQNMSVNEIANKLNRPVAAVRSEAAALGLKLQSK
jgi:hypothetical protein